MSLDFLQGPGKEFVESRAMERNGSGVSQILQWRITNGTVYADGLFERVIHSFLNHVHSEPVSEPVYSRPYDPQLAPTGFISIPGTGLRRVAIRVRGVAAKIPVGLHEHVEGQARHNRFGVMFSCRINQDQIGGHYVKRQVSFMPDLGVASKVQHGIIAPTNSGAEGGGAAIGLNTYAGAELTDEAHKMDRLIYFSVNGAASIAQATRLGWLSSGNSGTGDGVFVGGASDPTIQMGQGVPLGTRLVAFEARNEDGKNMTSLKPPHGLMFENPVNSIGLDVKIMGFHADTQMRPVAYRELKAL